MWSVNGVASATVCYRRFLSWLYITRQLWQGPIVHMLGLHGIVA